MQLRELNAAHPRAVARRADRHRRDRRAPRGGPSAGKADGHRLRGFRRHGPPRRGLDARDRRDQGRPRIAAAGRGRRGQPAGACRDRAPGRLREGQPRGARARRRRRLRQRPRRRPHVEPRPRAPRRRRAPTSRRSRRSCWPRAPPPRHASTRPSKRRCTSSAA
ncbi:MAG: hypothetical protein MZW92_22900 [Comamonadaceae bacterium]|nr:hypothetical protein [Comamonadaceae bacterium]